jgi:hypothetical protein
MTKMTKVKRSNNSKNFTRKNNSKVNFSNFQKEITVKFLETLIMLKLYHWKTYTYSAHVAIDGLYTSLNDNMDKFIEVLLGKSGERTNLLNKKSITLMDMNSLDNFKSKLYSFKSYLISLNQNKTMKLMFNSDLLNIRDEILGDVNKLLYLLTFK